MQDNGFDVNSIRVDDDYIDIGTPAPPPAMPSVSSNVDFIGGTSTGQRDMGTIFKEKQLKTPNVPFLKVPAGQGARIKELMEQGINIDEARKIAEQEVIAQKQQKALEKKQQMLQGGIATLNMSWKGSISLAFGVASMQGCTAIFLPIAIIFLIISYMENKKEPLFKLSLCFCIISIMTSVLQILTSMGVIPTWLWFNQI